MEAKEGIQVNRMYKDSLFCYLFGREEFKENALSLYNALNGTAYTDTRELEFMTIRDVIYIRMKNDVAVMVNNYSELWEQQSTYNPNMPVRGLMYQVFIYDKYIEMNKLNIYGRKLIKLPTPRYIVLYNGTERKLAMEKLRLSDAFVHPDPEHEFEWTATMINLGHPENRGLLGQCRPLQDYMVFVKRVRDLRQSGLEAREAVRQAIDSCIQDGILAEILLAHKAEVEAMCITEFNEKVYTDSIREEGREEGKKEGREEGQAEGRRQSYLNAKKEGLSEEVARRISGITEEEIAGL